MAIKCEKCGSTAKLIRFKKEIGVPIILLGNDGGGVYCERCYSNINALARFRMTFYENKYWEATE